MRPQDPISFRSHTVARLTPVPEPTKRKRGGRVCAWMRACVRAYVCRFVATTFTLCQLSLYFTRREEPQNFYHALYEKKTNNKDCNMLLTWRKKD